MGFLANCKKIASMLLDRNNLVHEMQNHKTNFFFKYLSDTIHFSMRFFVFFCLLSVFLNLEKNSLFILLVYMCHINVMFIVTHTAAILWDYFQHNLFAPLHFGISFSVCDSSCVWVFICKCVLACSFLSLNHLILHVVKTRKTNQLMQ